VIEELDRPEVLADYIGYIRRKITALEQGGQLCLRKVLMA